jgi:site-specific recombinase XerD
MSSIKIKLRKSTVQGRTGVLTIQVINNRKVRCLTTRFRLFPYEWDMKKEEIILHAADKKREAYLRKIAEALAYELDKLEQCREVLERKHRYTVAEWIQSYIDSSLEGDLFPFMERLIKTMKAENRKRTAAIYNVTMRSIQSFSKGADIPMDSIDAGLVKQYEAYLKARLVSMNTLSCYMRVWRAVYNRAVDEGLTYQQYPFKNVYTGVAKTVKRAVGESLITQLKMLDLQDELSLARDLFMFSFYTRGMSFVDMANLTHKHLKDGYLRYTRSKTRQKLAIRMEPCMEEIIERYRGRTFDDYLLPVYHSDNQEITSVLRTYNKRLLRISAKLELEKPLTSYVARHSWATIALRKGVPLQVISEGMGHENEHTTRIYLASLDQASLDRANAQVIAL